MEGLRLILTVLAQVVLVSSSDDFLGSWMGQTMSAIGSQTLLDLSLPGTHDTMTYDLSTQISDGGIDDESTLSKVLHALKFAVPGSWIRTQAQTQALDITAQLENGIRYLDFRVMYTSDDWYCLHMLQSNHKAIEYLEEVQGWVSEHPQEVIVITLTKHGNVEHTGNDQYPGVSTSVKQAFWKEIEGLFGSLLVNHDKYPVNETSIQTLVNAGQRVVVYASDYVEFTGSSPLALPAPNVLNVGWSSIGDETSSIKAEIAGFEGTEKTLQNLKADNGFYLVSLANSQPGSVIEDCAFMHFGLAAEDHRKDCAAAFNIPGMTYCADSLMAVGQLTAFYKQVSIDYAFEHDLAFPNAIYIDAVDVGGTLRTGTKLLNQAAASVDCAVWQYTGCHSHSPGCSQGWLPSGQKKHWDTYDTDGHEHTLCGWPWQNHYQCCRAPVDGHDVARFGYVDTLVAYNVRKACKSQPDNDACASLLEMALARRKLFPLQRWDDPTTGRHLSWPPVEV